MVENTFDILEDIIQHVRCKPDWDFGLMRISDGNARLVIQVIGPNVDSPDTRIAVSHYFPVPLATYNKPTWTRWLFECCRGVENHELGEWFIVGWERPFAPLHGPGEDPYMVHDFRDPISALTRQNGTIRSPNDTK